MTTLRTVKRQLKIETLEPRRLLYGWGFWSSSPQVFEESMALPDLQVQPGHEVVVSETTVSATEPVKLDGLYIRPQRGASFRDVELFTLGVDNNDNGMIDPGEVVATAEPRWHGRYAIFSRTDVIADDLEQTLLISAMLSKDAEPGTEIGVGRHYSWYSNLGGWGPRWWRGCYGQPKVHRSGAQPPTHTVVEEPQPTGTLTVSMGTSQPSQYLLGGVTSDSILQFTLDASGSRADVSYVGIDTTGDSSSVDWFELVVEGTVVGEAHRQLAEPGDDFGAEIVLDRLIVDAGTTVDVDINVVVKSDEVGGVSGTTFEASVDEIFSDLDTLYTEAIESEQQTVVMAKVDRVYDVNPDLEMPVPVGVSPIGQWGLDAAPHPNTRNGFNDVVADGLTFRVDTIDVDIESTSLRLYNKSDETQGAPASTVVNNGDHWLVTFVGLAGSVVNTEIDNGQSATFVLEVDIIDAPLGSELQVTLLLDSIEWLDVDGGGSRSFTGLRLAKSEVASTHYKTT